MSALEQVIPEGYKKTEVGMIPEDWEVVPFSQALTIRHGKSQKAVESESGLFPILATGGQIGWANRYLWDKPSVLIGRKGTINKPRYYDEPFWTVDTLFYSEINPVVDAKFIFYKFCMIDWMQYNEASGVPSLNASTIESVLTVLPSKKEQTAIANALSDVDALISELEKLIAKKQAIKTATMQQLLTGRTRLPQFALREDGTKKGYKQSELGEMSEDWDAIKMGDLARIQRGASPRPIDSPIWFDRNSSVGWLRISDVSKTNKYLTETTQSLSELGIANSRFVPKSNLVMSICATVGKPIITKKDLCIHDGFVVFNGLSVNQDYMYYILKELEDEWGKQGQTGSQMNLNTDLINGTYVAIPKDEQEQTAIATVLTDMDEETQALEQRLSKTRQIKQGMMQELLTGKTRLIQGSVAA